MPLITPMLVPGPVPGRDEAKDLKVALRLLSGKECVRDGSQAQRMLLRLAESEDPAIASDAKRLVRAGVANGWFLDRAPRHYELEHIAEATLRRLERRPAELRRRLAILTVAGLAAAGLVAYLVARSDQQGSQGWMVAGALALAAITATVLAYAAKRYD